MSYILGAAEYSEGEAVQKFTMAEDAMDWLKSKASLILKICAELI